MSRLHSNLKIGAFLARGHYGEVYMGTDDIHGEVAVKIFRQAPGESDVDWKARKQALLKEGQRLKQASHQNVVPVHHLLEASTGDAVHLAMEFCSGGSLQTKYEAGPLGLSVVRRHVTELALGLQALHQRNMLHRDIKPSNLLIDRTGTTKLADFGWVTDNLILGYGSIAGYSDHLAPEVHAGSPTSAKTDIWAVGMTTYRLLHGAVWYDRSPPPHQVIPYGGFADRLHWLPHIPKAWRRVIRKMLHDDPSYRYQNVGEVITALASLPTSPDWSCQVTASEVTWERQTANRKVCVVWEQLSPKRHEWQAWSEPTKVGRRRTLGGSSGPSGSAAVERALQQFFATQL